MNEKWSFFKLKFDNISLFVVFVLLIAVLVYADRTGSDKLSSWLEQTTTTVLGAYIGLTQANRIAQKSSNGGSNGTTQVKTDGTTVVTTPGATVTAGTGVQALPGSPR